VAPGLESIAEQFTDEVGVAVRESQLAEDFVRRIFASRDPDEYR
jgi:hypothetical protein